MNPAEAKNTFASAVEALWERLQLAPKEALTSSRLIKQKQKEGDTVDTYTRDFDRPFRNSYEQRAGMGQESKDLL